MKIFSFHAVAVLATIASLFAYANSASAATFGVTVGPNGDLVFSPSSVTIHPGDTVRWTWGSSFHSSTSGGNQNCGSGWQGCRFPTPCSNTGAANVVFPGGWGDEDWFGVTGAKVKGRMKLRSRYRCKHWRAQGRPRYLDTSRVCRCFV